MTSGMVASGSSGFRSYGTGLSSGREPANLGDILERVLDKGLVIAGDIQVSLLDIELLTIKLRLVIASLETAKSVGIDWWENDSWYGGGASQDGERSELESENRRLRAELKELKSGRQDDG